MIERDSETFLSKSIRWVLIAHLLCYPEVLKPVFNHSIFKPRPQGIDSARWLLNRALYDMSPKECTHRGWISVLPTYQQSFKSSDIAQFLVGQSCLKVTGSRFKNRSSQDVLADYFGLPTDFASILQCKPCQRSVIIDLYGYYNPFCTHACDEQGTVYCKMPGWKEKCFLKINMPIAYTQWKMDLCEHIIASGTNNHPAGYMSSALIPRSELVQSMTQALSGTATFGDMQTPLAFGTICKKATHKVCLADVRAVVGYRFFDEPCYAISAGIVVSVPTGNQVSGRLLFEPLLGNGRHWEIGLELAGNGQLWQSQICDRRLNLYGQIQITHLFSAIEKRSFDFCNNGSGSRYMLLEEIGTPVFQGLLINGVAAKQQYHGILLPAINATTLDAHISTDIQFDGALCLSYEHCDWTMSIAYNLWARTQEKIHRRQCFPSNKYAIKGDAQVYGFAGDDFIAINATESKATVCGPQGSGSAVEQFTNPNVDNAGPAFLGVLGLLQTNGVSTNNGTGITDQLQVNGSNQAILLTDNNINNCSTLIPGTLTHRLIFNGAYQLPSMCTVQPSLGVGSSVEFAQKIKHTKGAFSQWSVWLMFGCAF